MYMNGPTSDRCPGSTEPDGRERRRNSDDRPAHRHAEPKIKPDPGDPHHGGMDGLLGQNARKKSAAMP